MKTGSSDGLIMIKISSFTQHLHLASPCVKSINKKANNSLFNQQSSLYVLVLCSSYTLTCFDLVWRRFWIWCQLHRLALNLSLIGLDCSLTHAVCCHVWKASMLGLLEFPIHWQLPLFMQSLFPRLILVWWYTEPQPQKKPEGPTPVAPNPINWNPQPQSKTQT